MKQNPQAPSDIILYQTDNGSTRLEIQLQDETVWLSQAQMAELFQTSKQNVSLHIQNVFREGELRENSVVKESLTTAADGKDYLTKYYNLDVIISVGYRVKSNRGTQFRIWATQRLREYLIKGFALDDERLKRLGGGAGIVEGSTQRSSIGNPTNSHRFPTIHLLPASGYSCLGYILCVVIFPE